MRDAIAWVETALATKDIVPALTHLWVDGGMIHAADGRMTGAHPFPERHSYLVPGAEFKRLIDRLPGDPTIEVGESDVHVKSGRYRGSVPKLEGQEWIGAAVEPDAWEPLPNDLLDALRRVRPFISDNATRPWAMCAALTKHGTFATNNVVIIRADCSHIGSPVLLPYWAIDFLLSRRDGLKEWQHGEGYSAFRWENGAWMRAQAVHEKFPWPKIQELLEAAPAGEWTPGDEWRAAISKIAELSDGVLTISKEGVSAATIKSRVEVDLSTPVEEDTMWDNKFLAPVLQVATHWTPSSWPKPAPFHGPKIKGLVIGRSK